MNSNQADNIFQSDMIAFAQQLIRVESLYGREGKLALLIKNHMEALGYDHVEIDAMGNVIGRIGNNQTPTLLLDSHMDTVGVYDIDEWIYPPFGGEIHDGKLYGRGASDMKSSIAASIYAIARAKPTILEQNKTIYLTCTVCEECCDGEALKFILNELRNKPSYVMICEPSSNRIMLGHRGKAQIGIATKGISGHGAEPQRGENAIIKMIEVLQSASKLAKKLNQCNNAGSLTISDIRCTSASPNAIPNSCRIALDRRIAFGETEETVFAEMNALTNGKDADWMIDEVSMNTWTGFVMNYLPLHAPWFIDQNHTLAKVCAKAFQLSQPGKKLTFDHWNFSTNAVGSVFHDIPTIGFGPGSSFQAHVANEYCEVENIVDAYKFYRVLAEIIE